MTPARSSLRNAGTAGPKPPSELEYLVVGKLRRPHGVKGEIFLDVLTDFPERLKKGVCLYLGSEYRPHKLTSCRWHGQALLVSFEDYQTPEQVGELRNLLASVPAADRPALPEGEYYHHQILGLQAVTQAGQVLGTVSEILETGANDVYIIRPATGPEILLPAIDDVIKAVNLEAKQIIIELLPGLLPGE